MSTELLDAIHDMRSASSHVYNAVEDVASILSEVGMDKLSKRLMSAVAGLPECAKRIQDAHIDKVRDDISYSENMTAKMMLLALKSASSRA